MRAIRETFPYSSLAPLDSLIAAIKSIHPRFIIPCDDTAVQHLHKLHAHTRSLEPARTSITQLIETSLGSPTSYPIVRSRYDLLRLAREEALCVPDTSLIYTLDDLKARRVDMAHPLVLKADGTWGGNGVRIARTPAQATDLFLELTRPLGTLELIQRLLLNRDRFCLQRWSTGAIPDVVAQEYIAGRPANCAAFCWEGQVLAAISVEVVSTRRECGPASVVKVINYPEMLLAATRIARRLQISGFLGLDFMIEESTGTPYLIEMNPRCTRLCHLQLGKGRDMVAALCEQLTGDTPLPAAAMTQNELIAYYPEAWMDHSEFLSQSFHDVPQDEPELIRELLKDCSDRTMLGRLVNRLRRITVEAKESTEFRGAAAPCAPKFYKRNREAKGSTI